MGNPLKVVSDAIDTGINVVVGLIILALLLIVLGAIVSIPH